MQETEGVWKWVTGEEWSYTNWYTGSSAKNQPDNDGNEDYLHSGWGTISGWNDHKNNAWGSGFYFICEWE